MTLPLCIEAQFMATDGLDAPDIFVLWALRQRLAGTCGCARLLSTEFRRVLGTGHATPALAALEAAYGVLADHGVRPLRLLPPSCGHITHDEVCLLSLCCATQSGSNASARRQAGALVGPVWSPFLSASLSASHRRPRPAFASPLFHCRRVSAFVPLTSIEGGFP